MADLEWGANIQPVWAPQPGPQEALLSCDVGEVFYGGARGGGKSDGLLGDFNAHRQKYGKHARGILFRRTLTEMTEIESRALDLFTQMGAKYHVQKHTFTWPDGSTLRLAYLDNDADAALYQGHQYTWMGVDEVGNFPSPEPLDKLRATLRSPHGVPCYLRLTGNPGGPGHQWVRERYIRRAPPYRVFKYRPQPEMMPNLWVQAVFIPAKLEDNPLLTYNDPEYESRIAAAGGKQLYKAWRYGDWDAIVGAVFEEWRSDLHILPSVWQVPPGWNLGGGMDWGCRAPGCFLLFADGPEGEVYAIDEIYFSQETGFEVGLRVGRMCRAYGPVQYIAGDEQMWYKTGQGGPTIGEEVQMGIFAAYGEQGKGNAPGLIQASHGRGSRLTKLNVTRRYLSWKADEKGLVPPWGQPLLKFSERCRNAIRTIPALPYAPETTGRMSAQAKEDVDTTAEDHAYDALGAYLMSRPIPGEKKQNTGAVDVHPGFDGKGHRKPRWLTLLEELEGRKLNQPKDESSETWGLVRKDDI